MKVLILRKCDANRKSYNGFTYPDSGHVEAPDWKPVKKCGNGLHGLLWGSGTYPLPSDGLWQVIEADNTDVLEFEGKCKFRCGEVLLTSAVSLDAINLLKAHPNYPHDNVLNYDITTAPFAVSGDGSIQKAGGNSTQKAGGNSTQTAGDGSTQTAGGNSTQTAGGNSTQTAGCHSVQVGYWYDDKDGYQVATRKVTKAMAGKAYRFSKGKWTLVKKVTR